MLADVTMDVSTKERSRLFGILECAVWVALLTGPVMGSAVARRYGNQSTFLVACVLGGVNIVLVLATHQETLEPERRTPVKLQKLNPVGGLPKFAKSRTLALLGALMFWMSMGMGGGIAVTVPYVLRIDASSAEDVGWLVSAKSAASLVGLLLVLPLLLRHVSLRRILLLSTLSSVLSYGLQGFATEAWHFFALAPLGALQCLFIPIIRTVVANSFGGGHYGEALAAVACLEQLTTLVAGPAMNIIYGATVGVSVSLPGGMGIHCIAFAICSAMALLAACASATLGVLSGEASGVRNEIAGEVPGAGAADAAGEPEAGLC